MSNDKDENKRCSSFLDDTLNSARKNEVHPNSIFFVFGLIGKMAVEAQEEKGIEHGQAMLSVVSNFMEGLGMKTVSVSDDGENTSVH
jgi:hypothetical protein